MAWIEFHDDVWDHYKTMRLCKLTGLEDTNAVGKLAALWHFTLRNAWRDANLEPWGDEAIEDACRWRGVRGVFINALREVGFLDGSIVHGWLERAGRLVNDRIYNEKRRKSSVKRRKPLATLPNPTLPYPTIPNPTNAPPPPAGGFALVWAKYPSKVKMKEAERHYIASVKTMIDFLDIQKALETYKATDRVKRGFVLNGSTWFNNWRDWLNYTEVKNGFGSNKSGGAYIGAETTPGKYAGITENGGKPDAPVNG